MHRGARCVEKRGRTAGDGKEKRAIEKEEKEKKEIFDEQRNVFDQFAIKGDHGEFTSALREAGGIYPDGLRRSAV